MRRVGEGESGGGEEGDGGAEFECTEHAWSVF